MYKKLRNRLALAGVAALIIIGCMKEKPTETTPQSSDAGLKVPEGFTANIIADDLGKVRHIAVTPKGDIYARLAGLKDGNGTLLLSATDGKYAIKSTVGAFGGTGIFIKDGYLYVSSDTEVYRFKLDENFHVIDPGNAEK